MVDSSQTRLAYVAESTYGTTPSTPTWQTARFVSEGLVPGIQNIVSNEIRSDRNVSDLIQVGSSAGGPVNVELSYGTYDDWLESLMYSTWSSNVLKNGTTQKSFTLEKTFEAGATDQYHRFEGAIVNSLSLNMAAQQIVTGSFGFNCKSASSAQAEVTGSTYTAATTTDVINAGSHFASLAMTGITGPELTALNINVTNNLAQQPVMGSVNARGIRTGRFEVAGDLTMYFENEEAYELFLAGTAADLSFVLGGSSTYTFDIPNIKFESMQVLASGNDADVLVQASFRGLYDSTEAATLKITRTP